jgi:hypothetical protein
MWFLGYVSSLCIALALVREYAERRTNFGIVAVVAVSWGLGFSYFLVLPFDIAAAFCRACDPEAYECHCVPAVGIEALADLIPVVYGITMLLGYLMNDLLRGYLDSGEFTRRGRIKDALREAAIFYVPIFALGLVLAVYMIIEHGLTFSNLRSIGKGCDPPPKEETRPAPRASHHAPCTSQLEAAARALQRRHPPTSHL